MTIEQGPGPLHVLPLCVVGTRWLSERAQIPPNAPAATIAGEPAGTGAALARAAELLRGARRPLVHGFDWATVEDARAAVALADRLGALVATDPPTEAPADPPTEAPAGTPTDAPAGAWPGAPAVALRGASTATLGEIRDRSQLVVIWREDPASTHPRLLQRIGFANRTLVVVDDRATATAQAADLRLRLASAHDLEALICLHASARGLATGHGDLAAQLGELLELIGAAPHVAFVHGPGLTAGPGGERRALALHELVRALCRDRHVVTLALPRAAGSRAAEDVLAWQTGYSGTVDLASGHPELIAATEPLVQHEAVDVELLVEAAPRFARASMLIALSSVPVEGAEVLIRTAPAGVAATGTAHRLDGVPLALQAPRPSSAPTAAQLLARLLEELER